MPPQGSPTASAYTQEKTANVGIPLDESPIGCYNVCTIDSKDVETARECLCSAYASGNVRTLTVLRSYPDVFVGSDLMWGLGPA